MWCSTPASLRLGASETRLTTRWVSRTRMRGWAETGEASDSFKLHSSVDPKRILPLAILLAPANEREEACAIPRRENPLGSIEGWSEAQVSDRG